VQSTPIIIIQTKFLVQDLKEERETQRCTNTGKWFHNDIYGIGNTRVEITVQVCKWLIQTKIVVRM